MDVLPHFIGVCSYGHSISTLCPALLLSQPGLGPAMAELDLFEKFHHYCHQYFVIA